MKNAILGKDTPARPGPVPFKVKQALAAIELGKTDRSVFHYMQFFSSLVPVENKAFVHVIPDMSLLTAFYEKTEDASFSKYELKDQLANELLDEINQHFPKDKASNQFAILEGDPLEQLLDFSHDMNADLLFIGQDTGKNYHNILAKNLVRKAKGNALIIPNTAATVLTRILVPIDFSDNSKKALETAIGINRQLEKPVKIICLHVYEMPNISQYKIGRSLVSFQASIKSHIEVAMERYLASFDAEDRSFIQTQLILKDLPGTAKIIMETAEVDKADLVIMGVKGHSKVEALLMGSVAEKFLTINKSVPTLIVK